MMIFNILAHVPDKLEGSRYVMSYDKGEIILMCNDLKTFHRGGALTPLSEKKASISTWEQIT